MATTNVATLFNAETTGNLAGDMTCRHFTIQRNAQKPKRSTSLYTARGVKKCTEDEPIRTLEHVVAAQEFFLTKGKTQFHRLRNHMLFVLGCSTGLRGCDLLDLKISDVLNGNGSIKTHILTIENKTRKTNTPRINDAAREAILRYLDYLPEINPDEFLIKSDKGGRMSEVQLYRIMHQLNTKLGFEEHIGAHSLRKTFGYWTLKLHPDDPQALATLQQMLNHSSSLTTLRYCGLTKEDKDVYYGDIAGIFADPDRKVEK